MPGTNLALALPISVRIMKTDFTYNPGGVRYPQHCNTYIDGDGFTSRLDELCAIEAILDSMLFYGALGPLRWPKVVYFNLGAGVVQWQNVSFPS